MKNIFFLFVLICSTNDIILGQIVKKYDKDGLLHKKIIINENSRDTIYVDLNGNERYVYYNLDSMPTNKDKNEKLEFFFYDYILKADEVNPSGRDTVTISVIIEKDSMITNLRILKGYRNHTGLQILSNIKNQVLPEMIPGTYNGQPVPVEMKFDLMFKYIGEVVYINSKSDKHKKSKNRKKKKQ